MFKETIPAEKEHRIKQKEALATFKDEVTGCRYKIVTKPATKANPVLFANLALLVYLYEETIERLKIRWRNDLHTALGHRLKIDDA